MWQSILDTKIGSFKVENIFSAIIIFIVCAVIIALIMKVIKRIINKLNINNTFASFLNSAIKIVLYFIAIIIVADEVGIPVTSLVAVFSVAGLAISLSVQNSLANLAGGFTLLAIKPFKEGDFVAASGVEGTVNEIGLFYTKIMTNDNKIIFVPNDEISKSQIINYTAEPIRRVDIAVGASYDAELKTVENALRRSAETANGVLSEPKIFVNVSEYGSSSINYVLRAWTKTESYWDTHFAILENIKNEFDKDGIEMTYDHLNVHIDQK